MRRSFVTRTGAVRTYGRVLVMLSLVACSSVNSGTEPLETAGAPSMRIDPTATDGAVATNGAVLDLPSAFPIDAEWRALFNESIDIERAGRLSGSVADSLIEDCMKARGFDYSVGEPSSEPLDERVARNPLRRETLPYGYHLPPRPEIVGATIEMTQEMEIALDGGDFGPGETAKTLVPGEVPCNVDPSVLSVLEAQMEIDEEWGRLMISLSESMSAYDQSPGARQLNDAWSDCMVERGFEYAEQIEPRLEFERAAEITAREVAVRRADYDCDVHVKLTESRSLWQRTVFDEWQDSNAAAIGELRTKVVELLEVLVENER